MRLAEVDLSPGYGTEPYMAMMALTTSGLTVMVTQLSM